MHKIGPLPQNGGSLEHLPILWGNSPHPQTVRDMDPNFSAGASRVKGHLVLKYKVWGCPLRQETGDLFFEKLLDLRWAYYLAIKTSSFH